VGIPIDFVIAECAASRGVEIVYGDLKEAAGQLAGLKFDAILISGVLHLLPDPMSALRLAASALDQTGAVVATLPNVRRAPSLWRRMRHPSRYRGVDQYQCSGMHLIGRHRAVQWFSQAGLTVSTVTDCIPPNWHRAVSWTRGIGAPLFSSEYTIVAHKRFN
jgi:hypothetical protein